MARWVCPTCGGWSPRGTSKHEHKDAPQIYKFDGDDAARAAWERAAPNAVAFAPVAGDVVALMMDGSRVVASVPGDL